MLATLGAPPSGGGNAVEWKFDGQRATIVVEEAVLDGEIVAVDEAGRPSFTLLQRRWPQQRRPRLELLREVPVRLLAFDLLSLDGRDVTSYPYGQRRELLDALMVIEKSPVLTVPPALVDVSPADMLEVASAHSMEGILCAVSKPVRCSAEFVGDESVQR